MKFVFVATPVKALIDMQIIVFWVFGVGALWVIILYYIIEAVISGAIFVTIMIEGPQLRHNPF